MTGDKSPCRNIPTKSSWWQSVKTAVQFSGMLCRIQPWQTMDRMLKYCMFFIPLFYYDLAKKYIFIWKQSLWKQTQLQLFGIGLDPLPNQIWILLLNSLPVLFDRFLQWWDRLSNPKWFYSPSTQNQFYIFKEKYQQ